MADNTAHLAGNVTRAIQRYRRRAVLALQGAFLTGASVGLGLFHETPAVRYATLVSCMLSASSLGLAWSHRLVPATHILALQFLLLPVSLAITALGVYDSGMLIMPAGMLAMALVERPYWVAGFSLLNVAGAGLVFHATSKQWNGHPLPTDMLANVPVDGVTSIIVLFFCGSVATYIAYVLTSLLGALHRNQNELESKVKRRTAQLSASNDELRQAMESLDRARHDLVRGEKLASLGSLVAGVAHELNTPIGNALVAATTLEEHVEQFSEKVAGGALRRRDLDQFVDTCREGNDLVVRSLGRARDLVTSFKQVSVDQASERRRAFSLDELVGDVLRTLKPGLAGHSWIIEDAVDKGIHCDGYPGPLGQILANLVQNAVIHGFEGRTHGTVRITGRTTSPANWMEITVSDDGRGIPPEFMSKIFDPFYTTRLGQGGSGLGLTICHNLAGSVLGGQLDVSSTVGQGTQFTLRLPCVAPENDEDHVEHD